MAGKRKSKSRAKDLTQQYLSGDLDEDRLDAQQRFTDRSKHHQQNKIVRTALMRAEEAASAPDGAEVNTLPIGEVQQVFSLFSEVQHDGRTYRCVVRKTLNKISDTSVVVGDRVRFRPIEPRDETEASDQGVIEQILPRATLLTRADSFKGIEQHPIVANAQQMLIVASLAYPRVKWGLIDRMLVAARAGGLEPILCLNKIDFRDEKPKEWQFAEAALAHYATIGVATIQTSVEQQLGLGIIRERLRGKTTVLAGHSGVGKSSLIRAVQPSLDLRIGAISRYTEKGRHTTTSARRYPLEIGGAVIDTPGVKLFGLWNVTRENLIEFFPDVATSTAPQWRNESFERIMASLPSDG
jgi:ribosome biogenesis GTPase